MQNQIDKIKGTIRAISVDDLHIQHTYVTYHMYVKCINSSFYVYMIYKLITLQVYVIPHCRIYSVDMKTRYYIIRRIKLKIEIIGYVSCDIMRYNSLIRS